MSINLTINFLFIINSLSQQENKCFMVFFFLLMWAAPVFWNTCNLKKLFENINIVLNLTTSFESVRKHNKIVRQQKQIHKKRIWRKMLNRHFYFLVWRKKSYAIGKSKTFFSTNTIICFLRAKKYINVSFDVVYKNTSWNFSS